MDHQSFHGGIRSTNVSNGDQGRNGVDLTLKLGLPYRDNNPSHIRQHVHPVLTTSDLANFNFSGPCSHQEAPSSGVTGQGNINHFEMMNRQTANIINYGMVNQQPNAVMGNIQNNPNGGPSFNMNGWSGEHRNYMNTSGILMNNQQCNYSGAVMGVPAYPMNMMRHHQYYNNSGLGHQISQSPNLMIDNNQLGETSGSSSSSICGRKNSRSQRCGSSNVDPNKRCTNYNCNTNDTPMWRKGPLGPKTLCNACGIKYRKEGEKRRAQEAAKNSNG